MRQKNYHNLADNPHITVYTGIGSFVSTDVVEVVMHDEILQLQAPRIYINTGAETIIPPIDGVKDNPLVYTSTSIMELKDLPEKLIIVGGGYIGLEFASMFASVRFAGSGAGRQFRVNLQRRQGYRIRCEGNFGKERHRILSECQSAINP